MKALGLFIALVTMVVLVPACHPNPANYTVPAGYKTCHTSWDCNHAAGEFCGFMGVDTYAVCRQ